MSALIDSGNKLNTNKYAHKKSKMTSVTFRREEGVERGIQGSRKAGRNSEICDRHRTMHRLSSVDVSIC